MRFLVDAQLPPALARWLVAEGHAAEHVADKGLGAASDAEIWEHALRETWVIGALAGHAAISPALLSEIENGKKHGSLRTLGVLARTLRVDLDDLVPWPQD